MKNVTSISSTEFALSVAKIKGLTELSSSNLSNGAAKSYEDVNYSWQSILLLLTPKFASLIPEACSLTFLLFIFHFKGTSTY